MKIVHFSDQHASLKPLPKADLYLATGDHLPNFPLAKYISGLWDPWGQEPKPPKYEFLEWIIDPVRERQRQTDWCKDNSIRATFGNYDAPVVCVRGNHDFIDLKDWFGGEVYEIVNPTDVFEVLGLKIGGKRGIPYIYGEWSDEQDEATARDEASRIPDDLDILVTHAAPYQILDYCPFNGILGCKGLRRYLDRQLYCFTTLKLHCFGHIHGSKGVEEHNGIQFSNAATTFHEIEIA